MPAPSVSCWRSRTRRSTPRSCSGASTGRSPRLTGTGSEPASRGCKSGGRSSLSTRGPPRWSVPSVSDPWLGSASCACWSDVNRPRSTSGPISSRRRGCTRRSRLATGDWACRRLSGSSWSGSRGRSATLSFAGTTTHATSSSSGVRCARAWFECRSAGVSRRSTLGTTTRDLSVFSGVRFKLASFGYRSADVSRLSTLGTPTRDLSVFSGVRS